MARPGSRPVIKIPVENTPEFGQDMIDGIRKYIPIAEFLDDNIRYQNGVVFAGRFIPILRESGNNVFASNNENRGRAIIANGSNGFSTINNSYPENDGGLFLRNQILYSQNSDLVKDFEISGGGNVDVIRTDFYRAIRFSANGGNPSLLRLPSAIRYKSVVANMVVVVPDGGDFVFAFDPGQNRPTYLRIADTVTSIPIFGQPITDADRATITQNVVIKGHANNGIGVSNIPNDDLNYARNFTGNIVGRNSKLQATNNGGLYFLRFELIFNTTNPTTVIPQVNVTASRFPIAGAGSAFDRTNNFASLEESHPNYYGKQNDSGTVFKALIDTEGEMYFGSYSEVPSEILFYQIQVGSAFNVIR